MMNACVLRNFQLSATAGVATCLPAGMPGSGLGALGAVLGTALATLGDTCRVEAAAHRVVANARKILDATATDQHHRVLLEVVSFTTDVADDLETVGQAYLGDLAQRRVRLLRRGRVNARAHAAPLRTVFQRR